MHTRLLFLAIVLGFAGLQPAYAQLGFRLMNIEHLGKYGERFKPTLVPEISYYSIKYNRNIVGIGIGFGFLQTRQDTFRHYTFTNSTTPTVLEVSESYENPRIIPLSLYFARRLITKPLSPILGATLHANILGYNLRSRTGTSESYAVNESLNSLGVMPFGGVSYSLRNRVWLQLELGYQLALDAQEVFYRQVRTSLSAIYFL